MCQVHFRSLSNRKIKHKNIEININLILFVIIYYSLGKMASFIHRTYVLLLMKCNSHESIIIYTGNYLNFTYSRNKRCVLCQNQNGLKNVFGVRFVLRFRSRNTDVDTVLTSFVKPWILDIFARLSKSLYFEHRWTNRTDKFTIFNRVSSSFFFYPNIWNTKTNLRHKHYAQFPDRLNRFTIHLINLENKINESLNNNRWDKCFEGRICAF